MKTIKVTIQTNNVGSLCEDEFEIDDDASEEEIDEIARDVAFNMIEWNWKEVK